MYSSSRWAGAITRQAIDQFQSGMRNLYAEEMDKKAAISTVKARLAVPVGEKVAGKHKRSKPVYGYESSSTWFQKSRRLCVLETELAEVMERIDAGHPRVVCGGSDLWRKRNNLEEAGITEAQWRREWDESRYFLTADGETGKLFGNETIRVNQSGEVSIKVPAELAGKYGSHLVLSHPISFKTHLGDIWVDRAVGNKAIRYDIAFQKGKPYLDASWKYGETQTPSLETLRAGRTLGIDLNDGHIAWAVIDAHGNVVGKTGRVDFDVSGTTSHTDAQIRHLVTTIIKIAKTRDCQSITIENLNFSDARSKGRETMGRGKRGKKFRKKVAGIPTGKFRDRLTGMCATAGLWIIVIDPAYTTKWGKQHWLKPLKTSDDQVGGHQAAAVVIGRRGQGHKARRKPVGPRQRQRTSSGLPKNVIKSRPRQAALFHRNPNSKVTPKPRPPNNTVQVAGQRGTAESHQDRRMESKISESSLIST